MNIFIFDLDIQKNVQSYCDKHVRKMILEYAQILSNAHWATGVAGPYKIFNINHPSAVWARATRLHYTYVVDLAKATCNEFEYRFGKRHKTADVIDWLALNQPAGIKDWYTEAEYRHKLGGPMPADKVDTAVVRGGLPTLHTTRGEAVKLYREYFNERKQHIAKWTKRPFPEWFVPKEPANHANS